MMSSLPRKHWGEIDEDEDMLTSNLQESGFVPDVTVDIERSMNKFCLAEFDANYEEDASSSEHLLLQSMDPLMIYSISLHRYANDMSEMIRVAELAIESDLIPPADAAPPIPEMPVIDKKHPNNSLNFIPKEFTPFSLGRKIDYPEINTMVVKHILSKCVATMLAHIGFETTHQSILDFLTDVLAEFFKKITYSLKIAYEDEEKGQLSGFPNIAERVFVEQGLGGVAGLHDYYQTRVIKYIAILQKRCKELNKHYGSLLICKSPPPDDKENKLIRQVKIEQEDDVVEVDNPQVHLPIDGEVGFSSLDAGYQLLSSLEAGTSSQSLVENEEDTSITISPGVVSIPEADLPSTLSPFSKKKRIK